MHFFVFILVVLFSPKLFANPLPLDSVDSEPYLLSFVDPETTIPTPNNPFLSNNFQTPSFSSIQVNPDWNSEYTSTADLSESLVSTELSAFPCEIDQASEASAAGKDSGFCESPKSGPVQKPDPPKKVNPEQRAPPIPTMEPHSDGENMCDPTSVFNQHLCCDGPIGLPSEYAGQSCFYLIQFCHYYAISPCEHISACCVIWLARSAKRFGNYCRILA